MRYSGFREVACPTPNYANCPSHHMMINNLHESENYPVAGAAFFPPAKKMGVPAVRAALGKDQV